jgi:hypothetical protein
MMAAVARATLLTRGRPASRRASSEALAPFLYGRRTRLLPFICRVPRPRRYSDEEQALLDEIIELTASAVIEDMQADGTWDGDGADPEPTGPHRDGSKPPAQTPESAKTGPNREETHDHPPDSEPETGQPRKTPQTRSRRSARHHR